MFITIRYKTEGNTPVSKIIDADEILFIERSHVHGYKIQIQFKKSQLALPIIFGDEEELQYFLEDIHRLLQSETVKLAPAKEVRELNHLIEEDD